MTLRAMGGPRGGQAWELLRGLGEPTTIWGPSHPSWASGRTLLPLRCLWRETWHVHTQAGCLEEGPLCICHPQQATAKQHSSPQQPLHVVAGVGGGVGQLGD